MIKRITILSLSLLLLAVAAVAQTKVVDRSSKKTPQWLNTAVDDYLVVTVEAKTMGEAQSQALAEITERIIQAVATNVTVDTRNQMQEVNTNGQITSIDDFSRSVKMNSARLPFLTGISLSNADDIYWVKVQDKKTKVEHYQYSVKYPFSRAQLRQLVSDFEELDAEKVAQYEALESRIGQIESVEEIGDCLTQLETLQQYFFDQVRQSQVQGLRQRYRQLYDALTVTGAFLENGDYKCQVLLDGSPVRIAAKPRLTANCASRLAATPADGAFIITYDASDCLDDEENYIDILFRVGGRKLEHRAYLNGAGQQEGTFQVVPEGRVILTAESVTDGNKIENITIRLTLNNRGGIIFALKSIELHLPEVSAPIVFDNINNMYSTKGIINVTAEARGTFTVLDSPKSPLQVVQGAITVVNPQSQSVERIRLTLPYATNWR